MSADTTRFAPSEAREGQDTRRAKVAPLLAAGLSVRAISAETGISVGAVHRAKRHLEKDAAQGREKAAAIAQQLPTSYLVKQDIGGVPQDVRRLTVAVFERAVESAIGRGLLGRGDRDNPWTVVSALFASMFDDHTIEWLNKRGYLRWDERCRGEAIIAAVNALIGRQR
jgi:Homeodomain-like domain-containing protein